MNIQTTLEGNPSVGCDRSARVDDAELTEASDDLLITEALLRGVPGRDSESLWWVRDENPPLGDAGTPLSEEALALSLRRFCCRSICVSMLCACERNCSK